MIRLSVPRLLLIINSRLRTLNTVKEDFYADDRRGNLWQIIPKPFGIPVQSPAQNHASLKFVTYIQYTKKNKQKLFSCLFN